RQDEETRRAERSLLDAEVSALPERAAVCLLADERNPRGLELAGEPLEPLRAAGEVPAAKVRRARRRPVRGVRHADAVVERLPLLLRHEQPSREPRRMEEPPEVVARIREVRRRRGRHAAGVDPAEEHAQVACEDVWDRAGRSPHGGTNERPMTNATREIVTHGCRDRAGCVPIRPQAGDGERGSGRLDLGLSAVEPLLEAAAKLLARDAQDRARATWLAAGDLEAVPPPSSRSP